MIVDQRNVRATENTRQACNMAKILLVATAESPREKRKQLRQLAAGQDKDQFRPRVQKDQCAYCKRIGRWARECLSKAGRKTQDLEGRCKVLVTESGDFSY